MSSDAVLHSLDPNQPPPSVLDRLQHRALAVGLAGAVALAVGALTDPVEFYRSYLVAYVFVLGIALGSLALLMVNHMTGGAWGVVRRVLEAATSSFPLLAVLVLPIIAGMTDLYPWARPGAIAGDAILLKKQPYLNVPFFAGRLIFYFTVWVVISWLLNKWSREQDRAPGPVDDRRFRLLSGPGLLVYGLTSTFASVDLVMSLDPHWYSTIYGLLFIGGQGLSALAFAIVMLTLLSSHKPLADIVKPSHLHDLGKLLFAFVMLWAYLSFSQFLIIWSANLPEEVPWYLERSKGFWQILIILIAVAHFALPFLLLLSRDVKRSARRLSLVAGLLIVMRFADLMWLAKPSFAHAAPHWLDLAAFLGLGGLWLAFVTRQLKSRPLLPVNDPYLKEALQHEHH